MEAQGNSYICQSKDWLFHREKEVTGGFFVGVHMAILQFRGQFHSHTCTDGSEQEMLEGGLKFYDKWWGIYLVWTQSKDAFRYTCRQALNGGHSDELWQARYFG